MKVLLEGEPSEIITLLKRFPPESMADVPATETSIFALQPTSQIAAMVSAFTEAAGRIVVHGEYSRGKRDGLLAAIEMIGGASQPERAQEPEPEEPEEEPADPPVSEPETFARAAKGLIEKADSGFQLLTEALADGRQPALKDQITHFLERRGRAKLGEIATGVGLPNAKITPRLAELCNAGFVTRDRKEDDKRGVDTEYTFARRYTTAGRQQKAALSEPAPVMEAAAPASAPRSTSVKETILNFVVEYGEPTTIREIAEYCSFGTQAVRSRLSELVKDGYVARHSDENVISFTALKTWAGDPVRRSEAKVEEVVVEADPAPVSDDTGRRKRQPNMKQAITDILADLGGRAPASQIIARMHGVRGKTVHARLAELSHDGFVQRHFDPVTRASEWELRKPFSHEQKIKLAQTKTVEPAPVEVTSVETVTVPGVTAQHAEYLRIMGALADHPNSSYYDLEKITGMDRSVMSKRLGELERSGLVEREGHNPVTFIGRPPTRKNQNPPPVNSLNEAVIAAVREHPGNTSAQLAIRMMKSWSEVARRLHDLEKTTVDVRIDNGKERYYLR